MQYRESKCGQGRAVDNHDGMSRLDALSGFEVRLADCLGAWPRSLVPMFEKLASFTVAQDGGKG